jgi:hypothetical protein
MTIFLVRHFEPHHQTIFVHVDATHLLCNQAAILPACVAGIWFAVLRSKMFLHRFDHNVFNVGCGNAGDRSDRLPSWTLL